MKYLISSPLFFFQTGFESDRLQITKEIISREGTQPYIKLLLTLKLLKIFYLKGDASILTKRNFPSYHVACLIFFLLVCGIIANKGIAPETPEREYEKDLETIGLRFGTTMLVSSLSHSERLCQNTGTPEGFDLDHQQFSRTNLYPNEFTRNKRLSPSISVSIKVPNTKIIEGDSFTLEVLLENEETSKVEDVTVSIALPSSLTSNSTSQSLGTIFGCGAGVACKAFVSFTILAKEAGTHTITVSVSAANAATVSDSVTVTVLPSQSTPSSEDEGIPGFTIIPLFLGLSAFTLLFRIRRK